MVQFWSIDLGAVIHFVSGQSGGARAHAKIPHHATTPADFILGIADGFTAQASFCLLRVVDDEIMPAHGPPNSALPPFREHVRSRCFSSRPFLYIKRAVIAASYPIRGIWYFTRHREFWPLLFGRLVPLSLISFFVYFVLFSFAFLPQYLFLALFHGWGAWLNAVVLVLGEGLIIVQGLFEGFFVDECRVDVFDVSLTDDKSQPVCASAKTTIRPRSSSSR